MAGAESLLLVELPDPCLLLVLQYLAANNQRSLFSAARAHSRLRQAAQEALRSITLQLSEQQQMDGVMAYLGEYGQQVNNLELKGHGHCDNAIHLRQLPRAADEAEFVGPQLQLTILQLQDLRLQLQPGNGAQGVPGAAGPVAALKQLRLDECNVVDEKASAALAAVLSQLPAGLERLSICAVQVADAPNDFGRFPAGVLQQLQALTHLELPRCTD